MMDLWDRVSFLLLGVDGVLFAIWAASFLVIGFLESNHPLYKVVEKVLPVLLVAANVLLYIGVALLLSTCFR